MELNLAHLRQINGLAVEEERLLVKIVLDPGQTRNVPKGNQLDLAIPLPLLKVGTNVLQKSRFGTHRGVADPGVDPVLSVADAQKVHDLGLAYVF